MSDYEMKRVKILKPEEFKKIKKDGKLSKSLKESMGISSSAQYGIGDSLVRTKISTVRGEVLNCSYNGREFYYVVINPVDEENAFCYSLYPLS